MFAIDNGAYSCWKQNIAFDSDGFANLVERHGAAAQFIVIPDKVAAGKDSLEFSRSWMPELKGVRRLLLAVQDGMTADDAGAFIRHHPGTGIFLGGSTEWKLKTLYAWGMVAHALGCYYHVGRVNTKRRIRLCAEAGAHSFDGTSATRYSSTLPMLNAARMQDSLLTPGAMQ